MEVQLFVIAILSPLVMTAITSACPPGQFQGLNGCQNCEEGFYTDKENTWTACKSCRPCKRSMILKSPCSSTHDSVCTCKHGTYWDYGRQFCKTCKDCGENQVLRKCGHVRNTICSPCRKGTYYNSTGCSQCSTCSLNQHVLTPCNATNDTVCATEKPGRTSTVVIAASVGAVLTLLLIVLIALLLCLKPRKKRKNADSEKQDKPRKRISMATEASNLTLDDPHSDCSRIPPFQSSKRPVIAWASPDNIVSSSNVRSVIGNVQQSGKRIMNLSYETKTKIAMLLIPSSPLVRGWQHLASKAGYSLAVIRYMESNRHEDPVSQLLADMGSLPGYKGTVPYLRDLLVSIDRHDVADVVTPELYETTFSDSAML